MLNHTKLAIICSFISLVLTAKVLDPNSIRNFMYTSEITGLPDLALPTENRKENDKMVEQVYEITMKPTFQQMLPGNYSKTLLYAYSVKTSKG